MPLLKISPSGVKTKAYKIFISWPWLNCPLPSSLISCYLCRHPLQSSQMHLQVCAVYCTFQPCTRCSFCWKHSSLPPYACLMPNFLCASAPPLARETSPGQQSSGAPLVSGPGPTRPPVSALRCHLLCPWKGPGLVHLCPGGAVGGDTPEMPVQWPHI